jgi:hypothetical protein
MRKSLNDDLARLAKEFQTLTKGFAATVQEVIDDFIYTEQQEKAWLDTEPTFTKRIATPSPTKQQRRVTLPKVG